MLVSATSEVVRIMGAWVRRADAGLAVSAARNAAESVADAQTRHIDEARALRDLSSALGVDLVPSQRTHGDSPAVGRVGKSPAGKSRVGKGRARKD